MVVVVWGVGDLFADEDKKESDLDNYYFLTEQFGMEPRVVDSEPFRLCEILWYERIPPTLLVVRYRTLDIIPPSFAITLFHQHHAP